IAYITPDLIECEVDSCTPTLNPPIIIYFLMQLPNNQLSGFIYNNESSAITITFSSLNGYGICSPASFTLNPTTGTTVFFDYIPNPGFTGGEDTIVVSIAEIPCITLV